MGLPDGAEVYGRDTAERWAMGSSHGSGTWHNRYFSLEYAGFEYKAGLMHLPPQYAT